MTYGKLRQFRRDRLYASDRERVQNLTDMLKKNRVADGLQNCNQCFHAALDTGSPNKTGQNKNWDHSHAKGNSTQKISPTKTAAAQKGY